MKSGSITAWPKISIVTPCFNHGAFLEQTIRSVLDQNYPNLEYIIIDGGSTDESVEIIKRYKNQLGYCCSEEDSGHYAAVNKGFSHATGEIMAWLNSDDMYCPWSLKTVGSIFRKFSEVRWITTLNQLAWNSTGFCTQVKSLPGYSAVAFADGVNAIFSEQRKGFIQQESTFWRRSLWDEVNKLDETLKFAADFDLWARFFERDKLYGVISPLAGFRLHDSNRSLDQNAYMHEVKLVLKEFRQNNPNLCNQIRLGSKFFLEKIFRERIPVQLYSASNIYHSKAVEGDEWIIREVKF